METTRHPRQQGDGKRRYSGGIVARGLVEERWLVRLVVGIPDIEPATSKSALRQNLKVKDISSVERHAGRKRILVNNSRRSLKGPDFIRCDKINSANKVVGLPSIELGRRHGPVELELPHARIPLVGQFEVDRRAGCSSGAVLSLVSVPGR